MQITDKCGGGNDKCLTPKKIEALLTYFRRGLDNSLKLGPLSRKKVGILGFQEHSLIFKSFSI